MSQRRPRRAFSLIEIAIAVAILAISVAPLMDLTRVAKKRGLTDERLLAAHLEARGALLEAIDGARREGFRPQPESPDPASTAVSVERVERLLGLWRVTASAPVRHDDGTVTRYSLTRLVEDSDAGGTER